MCAAEDDQTQLTASAFSAHRRHVVSSSSK
jgi:hypothetical protein